MIARTDSPPDDDIDLDDPAYDAWLEELWLAWTWGSE